MLPSDAAIAEGRHLLLIDLSAIYYQAWHSQSPHDAATAAHDATVRRVRQLAERFGHVAVCCDHPSPSWRKLRYAGYKAHREAKPPDLLVQLRNACETLLADGFLLWEVEGYEADDVIASAVAQAPPDVSLTIATADKDLSQLVGPGVRILSTRDSAFAGVDEVTAKYGVGPELLGDWLALVGDTSDNIPGVPGVGAKTATLLLQRCGSILGVLDMARDEASEMKARTRESLLRCEQTLALARTLVELRRDVPVDVESALLPRTLRPLRSASDQELGAETYEETSMDHNEELNEEVPAEVTPAVAAEAPPAAAEIVRYDPPPQHIVAHVTAGSDDWTLALEPQSPESAWKLAGVFFNSRMFGGFRSREAVFAAIMLGRTLGLPAATVVRGCHVIEGKLTMSAQLIVGLVMKSGLADYFKCSERSPEKCTWKSHRKGDPDVTPVSVTWTIADARRAGLARGGSGWEKYPSQMLSARASVDLARMVYPDVAGGLYTPEELEES